MIRQNDSCNPAVHNLCIAIARKCTDIISPLLGQEEVNECLREMYLAAREILDKPPGREPEV
jgi:hypothetical protein